MDLGQVEKVAKTLADETSLKLYEYIATHHEVSCSALVELRGVTPATISHHPKILSEAGLITCGRKGQFVRNQANPEVLDEFTISKGLGNQGQEELVREEATPARFSLPRAGSWERAVDLLSLE